MTTQPFIDDFSKPTYDQLGEQLLEIASKNSYGKAVTKLYYVEGVPKFDVLLKDDKFYEHGFTFHLTAYEGGIMFSLIGEKSYCISALKRSNITKFEFSMPKQVEVISDSVPINMLKTGAYGKGLIGSLVSIGIGQLSEKIRGIKTQSVEGLEFYLFYNDENGAERKITIYAGTENVDFTFAFLTKLYKSELDEAETSKFLKSTSGLDSNCYVATACYRTNLSPEIIMFRKYRDEVLNKYLLGRIFIRFYYWIGPFLLNSLASKPIVANTIRVFILDKIYNSLEKKYR